MADRGSGVGGVGAVGGGVGGVGGVGGGGGWGGWGGGGQKKLSGRLREPLGRPDRNNCRRSKKRTL